MTTAENEMMATKSMAREDSEPSMLSKKRGLRDKSWVFRMKYKKGGKRNSQRSRRSSKVKTRKVRSGKNFPKEYIM